MSKYAPCERTTEKNTTSTIWPNKPHRSQHSPHYTTHIPYMIHDLTKNSTSNSICYTHNTSLPITTLHHSISSCSLCRVKIQVNAALIQCTMKPKTQVITTKRRKNNPSKIKIPLEKKITEMKKAQILMLDSNEKIINRNYPFFTATKSKKKMNWVLKSLTINLHAQNPNPK